MNKKHLAKNFMEPVPVENFSNDEREMSFDSESQILKFLKTVIVLNSAGIPINIPVQNTSLDIEVDQTNGSLEEREKVSKTVVKENDLRKTFPCLESGGLFTYKSLIGIHKFFDYSVKGEYSGWIDEIKSEQFIHLQKTLEVHFHGDLSQFFTHTPSLEDQKNIHTDLFLFCCPSQTDPVLQVINFCSSEK